MPYTIEYNAKAGLIASHAEGVIHLEEIKGFARDLLRAMTEHNCRLLLNDYREAKIALSTMDIHNLPGVISELLAEEGIKTYEVKRALVTPTEAADYTFFENVSINRSHNVRLFRDIEKARAWLLAK